MVNTSVKYEPGAWKDWAFCLIAAWQLVGKAYFCHHNLHWLPLLRTQIKRSLLSKDSTWIPPLPLDDIQRWRPLATAKIYGQQKRHKAKASYVSQKTKTTMWTTILLIRNLHPLPGLTLFFLILTQQTTQYICLVVKQAPVRARNGQFLYNEQESKAAFNGSPT